MAEQVVDKNVYILTYTPYLYFKHNLVPFIGKEDVTKNAAVQILNANSLSSRGLVSQLITKSGPDPAAELAGMLAAMEELVKSYHAQMHHVAKTHGHPFRDVPGTYKAIKLFPESATETEIRSTSKIEDVIKSIDENLLDCTLAQKQHEGFLDRQDKLCLGLLEERREHRRWQLVNFHQAICRVIASRLDNLPRAQEFLRSRLKEGHEWVEVGRLDFGDYSLRVSLPGHDNEVIDGDEAKSDN